MHSLTLLMVVLCGCTLTLSFPIIPTRMIPVYSPQFQNNMQGFQTRGPFDFIGEWIQGSDWFPIEINIPNAVQGIGQGITNGWNNIQMGFNSFAQNIPFINRFQAQFQQNHPRPYKVIMLVPSNQIQQNFNPFENEVNSFPSYP